MATTTTTAATAAAAAAATGLRPLPSEDAAVYAEWFACLADPTRVRLLHAVASGAAETPVGVLADSVGVSQSTCSHHLRKLADAGFVRLRRERTTTLVSVNPACCTGLPQAADVVMGAVHVRPCCDGPAAAADTQAGTGNPPGSGRQKVTVRAQGPGDWDAVRRIYAEGIETGEATFATEVPSVAELDTRWLPGHRWVAAVDGRVAGWATAAAASARACYAGVAETSVYVDPAYQGRGVGSALLRQLVTAADGGGLWMLQATVFPSNRASVALHHSAGFRTVGVRERIGRDRDGVWRDTVLLERRSATVGRT